MQKFNLGPSTIVTRAFRFFAVLQMSFVLLACGGGFQPSGVNSQPLTHTSPSNPTIGGDPTGTGNDTGNFKSCSFKDFALSLPVRGVQGRDWSLLSFVDLAPSAGSILDYMGNSELNAMAFDGRNGIAFGLANFRIMDRMIPVTAAIDGVVEQVMDGNFDRHLVKDSTAQENMVAIRATNGFLTTYLHLHKGVTGLKVGDQIGRGDFIGYIGSSGYASLPQLQFEIRDCQGNVVDPVQKNLFLTPLSYEAPPALMDFYFRPSVAFTSLQDTIDITGNSPASVLPGVNYYYALEISNVKDQSALKLLFYKPDGSFSFEANHTAKVGKRISAKYHWWGSFHISTLGTYTIIAQVNGVTVGTTHVTVAQ